MNNTWVKILVFGLLFGIGGFLIGRCCGTCHHGCAKGESCEMGMRGCPEGHGDACMHGKEGGMDACCMHGMGMHGEEHVHMIIADLEKRNFQGDTTIAIDGGTVNVDRSGDKTTVKVQMQDSVKKDIEVTVGH